MKDSIEILIHKSEPNKLGISNNGTTVYAIMIVASKRVSKSLQLPQSMNIGDTSITFLKPLGNLDALFNS